MKKRAKLITLFIVSISLVLSQTPVGLAQQNAGSKIDILDDIGIEQKLNDQVPLDLTFTNENGEEVQLKDLFRGKPVVLSLVYYECPMLCTMILNGLLKTLNVLSFDAGDEFDVITVSFDPRETSEMASKKKTNYLEQYGREGASEGWHFLTGEEAAIKELTDAVGFKYKYNPENDQYVHASGIMVLTPAGKISRYAYGVEYSPRDLKLALMEASKEKIGSPVDQLLLYCYHYDPATGKYGVAIMNVIRIVGSLTVIILVSFIVIMLRRDRRAKNTLALNNNGSA